MPASELAHIVAHTVRPAFDLLFHLETIRQWPRLFQEGIDPVVHYIMQANNTALVNHWLDRGSQVAFISSFPRSGNTWMRFMLSDVVLQLQGLETSTQLSVSPDNLIAEFSSNSMTRRIRRCPRWAMKPSLAFVKAHASFVRLEKMFLRKEREARACKALYIYRSPEDALVSLYHFRLPDKYSRSRRKHGIDAFARREVSGWMENIRSYLRAADEGFPIFFISYEEMLERPAVILTNLLRWLEVEHDPQIVHRAVSNMRFCNLQALERQENKTSYPTDENALFFRRGRSGSGRSELSEATVQQISDQTSTLLREANHRRMRQTPHDYPDEKIVLNLSGAQAPLRNGESRETEVSLRLNRL